MDEILDYLDECCGEDSYSVLPDGTIIVADWAFVPLLSVTAARYGRYVTRDSEGNYVIGGRNMTMDYPVNVGAVDDGALGWAAATTAELAVILGAKRLQRTAHGHGDGRLLTYSFGPGANRSPVPTSASLIKVLKSFPEAIISAAPDAGLRISIPFPADAPVQSAGFGNIGHGAFNADSEAYGITDVFDRWSGPIALERAGEFAGQLYPRVDSFGYGG